MDFQFVINSAGQGKRGSLALRLCRELPAAGGRLLSVFFHGQSVAILLREASRQRWQQAAGPDTRLMICSAAWQQCGGTEVEDVWQIAGWPVWYAQRDVRAKLISFGSRS